METSYIFSPELTPSRPSSPKLSLINSIPSTSQLNPSILIKQLTRTELIQSEVESNDLKGLQRLSCSNGGFISAELRRKVWPILLGCDYQVTIGNGKEPENIGTGDGEEIVPHIDEGQVRLDVNRSFVHYPIDISPQEKEVLRERLEKVIVTVLRRHPGLRYFQGYHDIISVLLLTLEDDHLTLLLAEKMSLHRIRDSMGKGLEPVLGYLRLVHRILARVDPDLSELVTLAASLPYFSLSWVLTLLSHDLTSLDVVARLFDFLLAHNPAMVSYLGVAIILLKKEELDNLDEEDAEDPAILHHTLSKLPDIQLSLPSPLPSPSSTEKGFESLEEDEDLMSNNDDSHSVSTLHLSESLISSSGGEEDELDSTDDSYSIFSDEMLSDPDVSGPAFTEFLPPPSLSPPPALPTSQSSESRPLPKIVYLDDLITKTLELWTLYPLSSETENGIKAEEVLGQKSCIFTWEGSLNGTIRDSDADEIARKGEDIVLPEEKIDSIKEEEERMKLEEEALTVAVKKGGRTRRRKAEISVGAVLTIVGVAGVILAIYGGELKEDWSIGLRNLSSKINWSLVG